MGDSGVGDPPWVGDNGDSRDEAVEDTETSRTPRGWGTLGVMTSQVPINPQHAGPQAPGGDTEQLYRYFGDPEGILGTWRGIWEGRREGRRGGGGGLWRGLWGHRGDVPPPSCVLVPQHGAEDPTPQTHPGSPRFGRTRPTPPRPQRHPQFHRRYPCHPQSFPGTPKITFGCPKLPPFQAPQKSPEHPKHHPLGTPKVPKAPQKSPWTPQTPSPPALINLGIPKIILGNL